ncbi:DNA methyltransferase [Streptomyces sp. J2-1]|uniref:type ISP restriction/modification enzyme n=1 Tax=Streptomyces corallincola TaxID=2851888 RepID=UPI001C38BEC8|nr:type ISP restriction/modification enzyme [Streptomyces corallincola]MBV2356202.1 DNA methyltransferase [Streptomyces corallincola]
MPSVTHDDAPPLADLMPWSVAPPRPGRAWPTGPDPAALRARWDALLAREGAAREALFGPSRARTLRSAVPQLPGRAAGTERLAHAAGPCAEPVRVLAAPFDEQWLIPDHRLLDAARPELWRVADARQVFTVETGADAAGGPPLLATTLFPLARTGRVRPLFRRPGGAEPNLAPGLLDVLADRLGVRPAPLDVLAWIVAAVRPGLSVPLPADAGLWSRGVASGHRALWLMRRDGERPRLPGGRRPYVRAPLPARPETIGYDPEEEALHLDEGRVSPVPAAAWAYEVGGARVLEAWFAARTAPAEPGTLAAIRPAHWPQSWTSELLELITVLTLLTELEPLGPELAEAPRITAAELRAAGVLPVPDAARRPASVLDHLEEGPDGQFALL